MKPPASLRLPAFAAVSLLSSCVGGVTLPPGLTGGLTTGSAIPESRSELPRLPERPADCVTPGPPIPFPMPLPPSSPPATSSVMVGGKIAELPPIERYQDLALGPMYRNGSPYIVYKFQNSDEILARTWEGSGSVLATASGPIVDLGLSPSGRTVYFSVSKEGECVNRPEHVDVTLANLGSDRRSLIATDEILAGFDLIGDGPDIVILGPAPLTSPNKPASKLDVFIRGADGKTTFEVTLDGLPEYWSPDGNLVAFVGTAIPRVSVYDRRSKSTRVLLHLDFFQVASAFWRDAETLLIALIAPPGQGQFLSLAEVPVAGGPAKVYQLVPEIPPECGVLPPLVSLDGDRVAYGLYTWDSSTAAKKCATSGLFIASRADLEVVPVASEGVPYSWQADGKLVFASGAGRLFKYDPAGGD